MTFLCTLCQTTNCVPNRAIGRTIACVNCKENIIVPGLKSTVAPVPKPDVEEKENSKPEPEEKPDLLIQFICPVCAISDDLPESVAKQKIQCKQCGVVSKFGDDGISTVVESKPFKPSSLIRFFCSSCEITLWGKESEQVRCNRCRLVLAPLEPDKMPLTKECRACGVRFPIDSEDSTLCKVCREPKAPTIEPPSRRRYIHVVAFYLLTAILLGLVGLVIAQLLKIGPVGPK